jgi:hypothetical protein
MSGEHVRGLDRVVFLHRMPGRASNGRHGIHVVRCGLQRGARPVLRHFHIHANELHGWHIQRQLRSHILLGVPRGQLCREYRLFQLLSLRRRFLCQQRRIERLPNLSGWPDNQRDRVYQLHCGGSASVYRNARFLLRHTGRIFHAMSAGNL